MNEPVDSPATGNVKIIATVVIAVASSLFIFSLSGCQWAAKGKDIDAKGTLTPQAGSTGILTGANQRKEPAKDLSGTLSSTMRPNANVEPKPLPLETGKITGKTVADKDSPSNR